MRVLFDSQVFDFQKYGGVSRYFSELFKKFNNFDDFEYDLFISNTDNEYLKSIYPFSENIATKKDPSFLLVLNKFYYLKKLFFKMYNIFGYNSNLNQTKRALKRQNFDIFHPTYYSNYFLKYLKNKPFVLTVYDMIHEVYPEYFIKDNNKTAKRKKNLILRADKIIAISENTKNDIIRFYGVAEEKVSVIYLGNSLIPSNFSKTVITDLPKKYILYVGSRSEYKNFSYFIKSVSNLLNKDKDINIVVAGGYSGKNLFSIDEYKMFSNLGIEQQISYYSVDDENLAYLYKNAICFVFPSLYEGFGIPVLEAFACDCPVVISNTSSLPEVGGDAAIYFNPTDSDSILESIKKVVYDESLRELMIARGRIQLNKFSWENTAKETLDVYLSL